MSDLLKKTPPNRKKRLTIVPQKEESSRVIKAIPKNDGQDLALRAIDNNTVTILTGVAGTGKTFLPVTYALQMLFRNKYQKIIFTRPVVEAGEHLGYLPGSYDEKIAPYMIPIMDILNDHLSSSDIVKMFEEGTLMVLPLAYMRGVTFKNSIVILDESQNATPKQLLMFLTRIGENSKVIVTGDPSQSDINGYSGLSDAIARLDGVPSLSIVHLDASCIVRDPIVAEISMRYAAPIPT